MKKFLFILIVINCFLFSQEIDGKSKSKEKVIVDPDKLVEIAINNLEKSKHLEKSFELLKKAAKSGNLEAKYNVARFYLSPKTEPYEPLKAYNMFVELANKDKHGKSQFLIGKFLLYGKIVNKDYEKAMYYFKLASKQRVYEANCYIAYMYAKGLGVFVNLGRAHNFAIKQYYKGDPICEQVWKRFNLHKYTEDKGFGVSDYLKPID